MIWKAILVFSCALCVLSEKRPAISEQRIERFYGHHGDLSHVGHHAPEHHEVYAWAYPSYEFSYYVNDPHTHDQKGQHEERDGDTVTGNYWLVQPDGRKRTVKYRSDHKSGFQAEVNYLPHDGHHHELKEHKEKHEHRKDLIEKRGEGHRADNHDDKGKIGHDEHRDQRRLEPSHGRGEDRDERRDAGQDKRRDDRHDIGRDGRRVGGHDEPPKGSRDEKHGGHDRRDHVERGHGEEDKKRGGEHKEGSRHVNRGDEGRLSGIHGRTKEHDHHKDSHHEARKLESRKGHDHEEHWRHGHLVGWTEGIGRADHRDDRKGRENHRDHADRRDQRSYHDLNPKFKPLLPYGHRLH